MYRIARHIVDDVRNDRLRTHHLVRLFFYVAETDAMSVAKQAFGQGQSLANGVDRFVAAAGDHAVRLPKQRRFKWFIIAIPFRNLDRRCQARIDVVQRVPK